MGRAAPPARFSAFFVAAGVAIHIGLGLGVAIGLGGCISPPPPRTIADNDLDVDDESTREWKEIEAQLPAPPKPADLAAFYVSPTTSYRFSVGRKSITVGADGVVRYTLIGVSDGGAKNVSFEGIRCETLEKRVYAVGRGDGTWARARNGGWERIYEANTNRQHAALVKDVFCPDHIVPKDLATIQKRLGEQSR